MCRTFPLALALALVPALARAQADTTSALAPCDGRVVSAIEITREPPPLLSRSTFARPIVAAVLQHVTTKPKAILPFMQVKVGQPCSEFRLAESGRVLRAQPYLANASVRAVPDSNNTVRIEVSTVDEIPLVIGMQLRGTAVSSMRYGNSNILGNGMYGAVSWRRGFAYREGFGARYVDYHLLDMPNTLNFTAERYPVSAHYELSVSHPFYTPFQQTAWFAGYRRLEDYDGFLRPDGSVLSLSVHRERYDMGGVVRLGGGTVRFFVGPLYTHESIVPAANAVVLSDTGFATDPDSTLQGRYASVRGGRFGGVFGVRALTFRTVTGFDALAGAQDVGHGVQLATTLAQSIGGGQRGDLWSTDAYAGVVSGSSYLAIRTTWESERQPRLHRWGDVVGSGRLAWYHKPNDRQTQIWSLEFAGSWRQQTPFQLTLGEHDGGVRGYSDSRLVGGQRLVLRSEHRWLLGGFTKFDNIGIAAFSDAGRMWAGGVPYGQDVSIRVSAGIGLLLAIPKQSRRLMRADLAVPLVPDRNAHYELRFTISTPFNTLWSEPGAIARLRSATPATNIFSWP